MKDALTELFNGRMKHAEARLRSLIEAIADDPKARPDSYNTVGVSIDLHRVDDSKRDEAKFRRVLEDFRWDLSGRDESLRQHFYEMDVEKQKPDELYWALFHLLRQLPPSPNSLETLRAFGGSKPGF